MIAIRTKEEVEIMAAAGKKLAEILAALKKEAKAGVRTKYFDELAFNLIKDAGAEPAFLGYFPAGAKKPYPATICISVNDTIVHGLPSDYIVKNGDIVKLDLGLKYKGFYVDVAVSMGIGNVAAAEKKLIEVAEKALYLGIEQARPGKSVGDIGRAVESFVEENGFSVVEKLSGHGVGRELHEEPFVFNRGNPGEGEKLKAGMVVAIEPMISAGGGKVKQLKDDSFAAADGSLSAHFEHTVAITEKGPRILTKI